MKDAGPGFFDLLGAWFRRLFEPKSRYGLTHEETARLVDWSSRSERGYDLAIEIALCVHDLSVTDLDRLLCDHGVVRPWIRKPAFPYQARNI